MSGEAARAFLEAMKDDAAFRERVMAVTDPGERPALIRAAGYDCTLEECGLLGRPLSDAELELAGGEDICPDLWLPCGTVFIKPVSPGPDPCSRFA